MKRKKIVILGAGPAGLGAAWRLSELGHEDFIVCERQEYVGGLATSFRDASGFTWDIGGHVLHSHFPYFDKVFFEVMEGQYLTHKRQSWVLLDGQFVPYPLQNNIHRLRASRRQECLDGLFHRKVLPKRSKNFLSWIITTYGEGIAKHFMVPYNRKVWAYPLEDMSYQWVADRVAPVNITAIRENILRRSDDTSWGPNAVFHYPKRGGTGDLWKRVARRFASHLRFHKEAVRIDAKNSQIFFSDGTSESYDLLFTSIPLDRLVDITYGAIRSKRPPALHKSAVTVVGIGIDGKVPPILEKKCWMYFPDADIPFFRATVLSNYSPYNTPKNMWSLMMEISSSTTRPLPEGDVVRSALEAAKRVALIPKHATITDRFITSAPYGYPTPTIERDAIVDPLLTKLEKSEIYSRGRFGMWKYEISNQDHTFMQGVEWVDRMLSGKEESLLKSVGK